MKKTTLLLTVLILAVSLLLSGCYAKEYKEAKEYEQQAQDYQKEVESMTENIGIGADSTPSKYKPAASDDYRDDEEETVIEIGGAGFVNKGDYRDDKTGQKCDIDYPFACSEYTARDGILTLTLKYNGYDSNIKDVEVRVKKDLCEPSNVYMESGTIKEFTCYIDTESGSYTGDVEIDYHNNIARVNKQSTGVIVANVV